MLTFHTTIASAGKTADILGEFGIRKINLQFVVQSLGHGNCAQLALAVDQEDASEAFDLAVALQNKIPTLSILLKTGVGSIGIYGPDFRIRPGIASNFLKALSEFAIPVFAISTSVSTCSALIPEKDLSKAKSALESRFESR